MWLIKGLFNTIIIAVVFGAGFYVRHWADPAFDTVERIQENQQKAVSLWPF